MKLVMTTLIHVVIIIGNVIGQSLNLWLSIW